MVYSSWSCISCSACLKCPKYPFLFLKILVSAPLKEVADFLTGSKSPSQTVAEELRPPNLLFLWSEPCLFPKPANRLVCIALKLLSCTVCPKKVSLFEKFTNICYKPDLHISDIWDKSPTRFGRHNRPFDLF